MENKKTKNLEKQRMTNKHVRITYVFFAFSYLLLFVIVAQCVSFFGGVTLRASILVQGALVTTTGVVLVVLVLVFVVPGAIFQS